MTMAGMKLHFDVEHDARLSLTRTRGAAHGEPRGQPECGSKRGCRRIKVLIFQIT
jgi:hypothetical protein